MGLPIHINAKRFFWGLILLTFTASQSLSQIITTVAGGATGHGGYWGDGGPATNAETGYFGGITVDEWGNIYIADGSNHRVRKVSKGTGIITTYAGTGIAGYNGDGISATSARLNYPGWITISAEGDLFISDSYNNRMRKVNLDTGIITTVAGNGNFGTAGDGGLAVLSELTGGGGGTVDKFGNIYLLERRRIRKIDTNGIITTFAGTGASGVTGEGVLAIATPIIPQGGISTDALGNVYFADSTQSIRKITVATGNINRVAGTGDYINSPYTGDGIPATSCRIGPMGIKVDDSGNIYIADMANSRIERVDRYTGNIKTVAGNGSVGFSGDGGAATSATLSSPQGVTMDKCGNLYIADFGNKRVRKVEWNPSIATPLVVLNTGENGNSIPIGALVTINATISLTSGTYLIKWLNKGSVFATTTLPTVTYLKQPGIDTITARIFSTESYSCFDSVTSATQIVYESGTLIPLVSAIDFSVFPNPATTTLTLSSPYEMVTVAINNLVGETVYTARFTGTRRAELPTGHLPPGMYLIRVNERWVQRFMKE